MGTPMLPGSLITADSKGYSIPELNERILREKQLTGSNDKVYEVPEDLDDRAKAYYLMIVDQIKDESFLSNLDVPLLKQTADTLAKIDYINEEIRRTTDGGHGYYSIEDKLGNVTIKEHPGMKTLISLNAQLKTYMIQLGMTPSGRAEFAHKQATVAGEQADPLVQALSEE